MFLRISAKKAAKVDLKAADSQVNVKPDSDSLAFVNVCPHAVTYDSIAMRVGIRDVRGCRQS